MTPLSLLLGACVGSFLNVCLIRWKSGGSIISPASSCPRCKKAIYWYDNIPVISFFVLRGKCRFCSKSISWQYPLVEALTSFLFLLCAFRFQEKTELLVTSFVFASFLVLMTVSDLKWRLLPHSFNNLFILAGLFFSAVLSPATASFSMAIVGGFVVMGSFLFGLNLFFPEGFGGGDIKMVAGLAIWLGVFKTFCVLIFACFVASMAYWFLMRIKKINDGWKIPFGPYLALGAFLVWFWPESIDRIGMEL
jgi:leader peptidase (prepilin peptidase) / N-methyltransferase